MKFALECNTLIDVLWIDLHIFRHVFGFCWRKPDGRPWRHLVWVYHRAYPVASRHSGCKE